MSNSDDIERLLREVDALGTPGGTPKSSPPARKGESSPANKRGKEVDESGSGGARMGFAIGAAVVLGAVMFLLGLFLPFVGSFSMGVGGAAAAFLTALAAGPPRWFDS